MKDELRNSVESRFLEANICKQHKLHYNKSLPKPLQKNGHESSNLVSSFNCNVGSEEISNLLIKTHS